MNDGELARPVPAATLVEPKIAPLSFRRSDRQRLKFMMGASVGLTILFARPLISFLVHIAGSELHSYILLIPFVAGYLFWTKRDTLPRQFESSPLAASLLFCLGCASLGAAMAASARISDHDWFSLFSLSFLFFLAATAFLILGRAWMMAAAFPFAFLIFLVPMPDGMVDALEMASQHASAAAAGMFFWLGNTPYFRDGMFFQLPNITLEVAQECSGIRSSWILFITSILTANLFLRTGWKRVLFISLVIPLGILRNGFRVWTIGALCVRLGPEMIHSPIHHRGGPIFFALSLVPFFLLLCFLRRGEDEKDGTLTSKAIS